MQRCLTRLLAVQAVAVVGGESKVTGTVTFTQEALGYPVTVKGTIKGLDANSKRGFHVQ
jgi:Cu-Zn family superoxide dismutase